MIKIKIPATTANVGPGFDSFGLALSFYNYVTIEKRGGKGISLENRGQDVKALDDPTHNLVVISALKVLNKASFNTNGLHFILENNIPVSRGLGSSAAAIVGGLMAGNELAGNPLTREEILEMAVEMEGHPDNVAPAIYGGFVASCQQEKTEMIKIKAPEELYYVVAIPDFYLSTKVVRDAMPEKITIADAVYNVQRASLLLGALITSDLELFSKVVDDKIHQPYRFPFIKHSEAVLKAAKEAGSLAQAISGAGPTLIAFATKDKAEAVGRAMQEKWREAGVKCEIKILEQDLVGAVRV